MRGEDLEGLVLHLKGGVEKSLSGLDLLLLLLYKGPEIEETV